MTLRGLAAAALKATGLVAAFIALFALGSALFVPAEQVALQPQDRAAQLASAKAFLAIGVMDVLVIGAIAVSSRLRGWRLWALLSGVQWFVMTVTSQLEAVYFMPNVTVTMLTWLLAMTLPVCLLFPPLAMAMFGLFRSAPEHEPAWRSPAMGWKEAAIKVAMLAGLVYPLLFFGAGYFIAWQSPVLREFYSGSAELVGVGEHFAALFASDPWVYAFEALRGVLWVGAALLVMRTTRGPAIWGTVLVGLAFALIQNNLHLLSNPLMPPAVQRYHFIETASSNFVWALVIGWMMHRSHLERADERVALVRR